MIIILASIIAIILLFLNPTIVGFGSALLVLILLYFGRNERNIINPYYLFLLSPLSLLIYDPEFSPVFLPVISSNTQILILCGLYSYLAGLILIHARPSRINSTTENYSYSFYAVLAIGITPHLAGIATTGVPLFADNVQIAREQYIIPIIGQFAIFLPVTILIAFQRRRIGLILIATVLNIALSIGTGTKFFVVLTFLFLSYGYIRYNGSDIFRLRPVYLLTFMALLTPIIFDFTFSVRDNLNGGMFNWQTLVEFESSFLEQNNQYTHLPYLYLTTPWSNFAYATELEPDLSYGARVAYPFASVLQLDQFLAISDRPIRKLPFNTSAFLTDFYLDFGVFGVAVLSTILGIIVKVTYLSAMKTNDIFINSTWVCIGFASMLLFFSNHFISLTYPILALILFNIYRVLTRAFINSR